MPPDYLLIAAAALMPLIWGTWRGWPAHRLLAATALGLTLAASALLLSLAETLSSTSASHYQDTNSVVVDARRLISLGLLGVALQFAALSVLHWVAHRFARPLWPRLTTAALWVFTLVLLGRPILQTNLLASDHYTDFPPLLRSLDRAGAMVGLLALIVLIALPVYALVKSAILHVTGNKQR